jgi:hypothetical protein
MDKFAQNVGHTGFSPVWQRGLMPLALLLRPICHESFFTRASLSKAGKDLVPAKYQL